MTVKTCTKVNIGLHVLRKRADGYHDLETLFVPYYWFGDMLTVEPAAATSIEITMEGGVDWDPQQDLTMRAWKLLKADFPQLPCVRVKLEKHAPVGAGLGGGSADAAFMLKALRDIGSLPLSDAELAPYTSRLGSDCSFFLYNRPMFGRGRGEILEPLDIDLSAYELRVEVPQGVSVSTREAYAGVVPRERSRKISLKEALRLPVEQWKDAIVNDFEPSVFAAHPEIAALKQRFYDSGAIYAAMSGSGSAVFGLFRK